MAGCDRARFRSMATETHASLGPKLIENTSTASIIRAARRAPLLRLLLLATLLLLRPASAFLRGGAGGIVRRCLWAEAATTMVMKEEGPGRSSCSLRRAAPHRKEPEQGSSQRLLREVPARVAAALKLAPHELNVVKGPGREAVRLDRPEHFHADAITTARWLLGARLVRVLPEGRRLSGRIVEVEAYLGVHDAAAHSFRAKRTAKNEAMYRAGGTAYIYQCHVYSCFNVICGAPEEPTGVLIRALEPEEGVDDMLEHRLQRKGALGPAPAQGRVLSEAERRRLLSELCAGPGRMSMALGLDRSLNGACLREGPHLFLEHGDHIEEHRIAVSGRVGVDYAGAGWARAPLRFAVADSKHVSKPWPWKQAATAKGKQSPPQERPPNQEQKQEPEPESAEGPPPRKGTKRKRGSV